MIQFDVETTSLAHHGANPCRTFLAQFGLPGDDAPELVWRDPDERGWFERVQELLGRDEDYEAWNTKFDLHCLRQAGLDLPPDHLWNDGMVKAHIIDERFSAALQARADKLSPESHPEYEGFLKQWMNEERKRRRAASKETGEEFIEPNYSDVPKDIMVPYGGNDIVQTAFVGDIYTPQIEANPDFKALYDMEMDVMRALFWAEDRGIPMDRDALVALEADVLPRIETFEDEAIKLSEFDGFNPRSPKQIGEALERLGANVDIMDRSPKTKQLVTDEENLLAVDHPLGDAILRYRGERGINTWLHGALHGPTGADAKLFPGAYLTGEDRLHPNFRQLGARTGRMSCSNPNFQNIPRDDLRLRYAVKAEPGHKLVTCDLDSIEMVLLAAFAGEGAILDQVRQDSSKLHDMTAQRVGLTGRKRATGAFESPRDQGKRLNYLIIYGGGLKAIQKWFGVTRERARAIYEMMQKAYPEVTALQQNIDYKLMDRGYLECPLTARRWRMYNQGYAAVQKEGYRFINYLIQGTAAAVLKMAMVRCHEAGIPLVAPIHDELLAHVPEEDADEAAHLIQQYMVEGYPLLKTGQPLEEVVPISAEAQIVDRWSQAKKPDYVPDYAKEP